MRIVPVPGGTIQQFRALVQTIPFDVSFLEFAEPAGPMLIGRSGGRAVKRTGEYALGRSGGYSVKRAG